MQQNTSSNFAPKSEVDLVSIYPISFLVCLRKTFGCLFVATILSGLRAGIYILKLGPEVERLIGHGALIALDGLALISLLIWSGRFIFEVLERQNYLYGIQEGHLVLSRGIVLKKRGFFPLAGITDVYLERTWLDVVFGLYTLHVATPTVLSERFARIDGLTRVVAVALQNHLTQLVNRSSLHRRGLGGLEPQTEVSPIRSNPGISHVSRGNILNSSEIKFMRQLAVSGFFQGE